MPSAPFRLELKLPLDQVSGTVGVDIQYAVASESTDRRPFEEMVELVSLAIDKQVLNDSAQIQLSSCKLVSKQAVANTVRYTLTVINSPSFAFLVLVSLLAQSHHAGDALVAVQIKAADLGVPLFALPELLTQIPDRERLQVGSSSSFQVLLPQVWDHEPSSAIYRFGRDLLTTEFEELRASLDLWGHLTHLGGFLFDFVEQDDFEPDFGLASQVTPRRSDFVWPGFEGWGIAYRGLLNIAAAADKRGWQVLSLELE
jgi:hypothetical protein